MEHERPDRYGTVPLWMVFPRREEASVSPRPPFPPFTEQTARQKVQGADRRIHGPRPEAEHGVPFPLR
jgi:hypothetical protein